MSTLLGKTALVTGGSRGIGRSIALALAEAGAHVVLTYHTRREPAEAVVDAIEQAGGQAWAVEMVLEDDESIDTVVRWTRAILDTIDILVNNAAMAQEKPFLTLTSADWTAMLRVNLQGPFRLCQEVIPLMRQQRWGRIVNLVSIGGQIGGVNQTHYAASKSGLQSLTRSLARLYGRDGITVNAVAPGLVATEMVADELTTPAGQAKVASIPLGRIATPDEVASIVAFLCSEEAGYINGATINCNGGMYCG